MLSRISLPEPALKKIVEPESNSGKDEKTSSVRKSFSEFSADFFMRSVLLGLILRLTIRDWYYPFSVFFYALPLGILSLLCLFSFLLYFRITIQTKRRFNSASFSFVLWVGFSIWWSQAMFFENPSSEIPLTEKNKTESSVSSASQYHQVLFWNLSRLRMGKEAIVKKIKESSAGLIGIAESGFNTERNQKFWETQFPEFNILSSPGGMVFLSRNPILNSSNGLLKWEGRYLTADIQLNDDVLKVFLIDINGHPLDRRDAAMKFLTSMLKPLDDQPVLVMGDFNLPTDSYLFEGMREQFKNTFEESGNGYSATWPIICPVLSLDQIWINQNVQSNQTVNRPTLLSDHFQVLTKISVLPIKPITEP
jgi:vancomycin resistance protein VanJ